MRAAAIPEMAIRVHTLDNGLSVYLSPNHEEPWVSCRIAVRAGAAQEPADATGLAHYLEHMLANKGTRSLGTRDAQAEQRHLDRLRELYEHLREAGSDERARLLAEIDEENQAANRWAIANELKQIYALLGARSFNAYTSHDRTVFVVDVPSNRLEAWARLEGNRFAEPVFRGFPTELETIVEEKNRALDNPARVLMMAANPLLWAGHPYGRDVLGDVEHLLAPSIAQTERFFQTWYVPNNMAVVLAGDLDPDRALALIEQNFGGLRSAPVPAREAPPAPALRGEQRVEVVHRGDEEVQLIWRTVSRNHPDADALLLADMMLDNNSTGLLDTRLEQKQKVRAAGAYPNQRVQGGTATVWGRPRIEQSLDEVEALLREQVQALRNGEFAQSDLDDLIANFEVGELRKLESNEARASVMLDAFMFQRDWDDVRTRLARLAGIGRDQVVDAARRWLGDELVVARRREGEPPIKRIPSFGLRELSLDSDSRSPLFEQVRALPAKPLELQVLRENVDFECTRTRAALLYRTPNPNNDLVQLTMRVHVGSRHDPMLSKALDLWGRAGVGELSLEQYRRALFRSAAAVAVECGRQQTDVTVAGRAPVIPEVVSLVRERLRAPVLTQEERDRWAADVVGKRKQRRETSDFKFTTLRQWALRGPRSPYLSESLRNEEVLALPLEALREAPGKLLGFEQMVVYAGPHEHREIVEMLELDRAVQPEPAYQPVRYDTPEGVRVFVVHHEAAQTKIGLFIPSEGYNPAHSPEYRVLHEYLGGSAGLVFQEIRESRGLAYAAHGGHTAGNRAGDQNLTWGSLASRPDRSAEAAEVLLGLFRALPGRAMHAQRFERAWAAALERLLGSRVRFRGYGFAAESWRLRGLDHDPRVDILPALERFTMEDLRAFVQPLETAGVALVVVGDTARMDMQALGRLGEIELRTLDELVVY